MSSKPKQSAESKELERIAIEREKQLNVENARQTTRAFSDQVAFRKKLRGIFSLLSGGFTGFPQGMGSSAGAGRGTATPVGGTGGTGSSGMGSGGGRPAGGGTRGSGGNAGGRVVRRKAGMVSLA
jgi:hypothetical protein